MSTFTMDRTKTFEVGTIFEDFVCDTLKRVRSFTLTMMRTRAEQFNKGETVEGYEIKLDQRCTDTSRLSIEFYKWRTGAQRYGRSTTWRPQFNTHSLITGNHNVLFVFRKARLYDFMQKVHWSVKHNIFVTKYLPFKQAVKCAEDVIVTNPEGLDDDFVVPTYACDYAVAPTFTHVLPEWWTPNQG